MAFEGDSEAPRYSLLLNEDEGADYFTSLQCRRYVRTQVGSFTLTLDDQDTSTYGPRWNGQRSPLPVMFAINQDRFFKGRIDTAVRHYDKDQDSYLITLTGRDDGGALQDCIFSKYYYQEKASAILTDLITKVYPSRKGTLDPTITLSDSFSFIHDDAIWTFPWDRISMWDAIEALCQQVEGLYSTEPLFLDFWVDEADELQLNRAGSQASSIDVGTIGGDWITLRDWTQDGLPLKNDVWVWGAAAAGLIPLGMDSFWCISHSKTASSPWTAGTAQYFTALWSKPANLTNMQITKADNGIHIHIDTADLENAVIGGSATGEPTPFLQGPNAPPYFGWEIDMRTTPFGPNTTDFNIFRRGPNGHLNFYNNDLIDETAGEINQINCTVRATGTGDTFNMVIVLIDGQTPNPSAVISPTLSYTQLLRPASKELLDIWKTLSFPIGPTAGGTIEGTAPYDFNVSMLPEYLQPVFFNWSDIVRIQFIVLLQGSLLGVYAGTFDIDFDGLSFTKPLVAGAPAPAGAETVRTQIITDATISNYSMALNRARLYQALMGNGYNYMDLTIRGRPDLQAGYTFTAEGKQMLIRESITTAAKDKGYLVQLKGWMGVGQTQ